MIDQNFITISQAARRLGVSTKTLRRWESSGLIKPIRTVGNQRRYSQATINEFIKTKKQKTDTVHVHTHPTSLGTHQYIHRNGKGFSLKLAVFFTVSVLVIAAYLTADWFFLNNGLSVPKIKQSAQTNRITQPQVLGENTIQSDFSFNVNVPANFVDNAIFSKNIEVKGLITNSNLVNSIVVGDGLTISGNKNNLKITNTGVLSLASGSGISVSGSTITNSDLGSSQNIFKTISVSGQSNVVSDSNSDTLTLAGTGGVTITTDASNDKITINSASPDYSLSGWSDNGTTVTLSTITDYVGIGIATPTSALHVVGSSNLAGNITLGEATTSNITFTGRVANGTSLLPNTDLGSDLGSSSLRFNNLWVGNVNSNSTLSIAGQAKFTYEPPNSTYTESSVMINPTAPVANGILLGLGVAGYQRAGVDEDGDLVLGYSGLVSAPESAYPLAIYGHNTTNVSFVDTSGNAYFAGNLGVGTINPTSKLHVTGAVTGKALSIFDETGDQSPLTASISAKPVFTVAHPTGTIVNGLTLTPSVTGSGVGFASTGDDTNIALSLDAKGSGALNLNNTGTGDILLGGGSASTGCTVTNSTGALACAGAISGATLTDGTTTFSDTAWTSTSAIAWNLADTQTSALNIESGLLNLDTTNSRVGIGTASPNNTIQVANLINFNNSLFNTLLGYQAGQSNTGNYNSAIGYQAFAATGSGDSNSAVGYQALSGTTGGYNSAMGALALGNNTTGNYNSAMGASALRFNTGASYRNSAMGASALYYNSTGDDNSAMGAYALYSNSTGNSNSSMGAYALYYNSTGNFNSAVGYKAGYGVTGNSFSGNSLFGYQAGYALTTGSNNILLGYNAGDNLTSGTGNIVLGFNMDVPSATSTNTLNIGNLIFATGLDGAGTTLSTGNVGIGTTTPTSKLHVSGAVTGKALTIFNETGDQDILTASASAGTTRFRIKNNGGVVVDLPGTGTGNALCHTTQTGTTQEEIVDCTSGPIADYMEMYPVQEGIETGDIVSTSDNFTNTEYGDRVSILAKSTKSYQKNIIGIVSDKKNAGDFNSIGHNIKTEDNPMPIALAGRLYVKISPSSKPVKSGDYLTTSDQEGQAMKAERAGVMIGKALEDWDPQSGRNSIMVFVNLSYADPQDILANLKIGDDGSLILPKTTTVDQSTDTKASQANLSDLVKRVSDLENSSSSSGMDINTKFDQLTKDLDLLKSQVLGASVSATLSSADSILSDGPTATLSALTVTGKTNLYDLGVTGNFNAGTIFIDGLNASLDSLGIPLKFQSTKTADISFLGDAIVMDKDGNFQIKEGRIIGNDQIRGINVKVDEGKTELIITFSKPRPSSSYAASVTPSWLTQVAVQDKKDTGFKVVFSQPSPKDAYLDWIVID